MFSDLGWLQFDTIIMIDVRIENTFKIIWSHSYDKKMLVVLLFNTAILRVVQRLTRFQLLNECIKSWLKGVLKFNTVVDVSAYTLRSDMIAQSNNHNTLTGPFLFLGWLYSDCGTMLSWTQWRIWQLGTVYSHKNNHAMLPCMIYWQ